MFDERAVVDSESTRVVVKEGVKRRVDSYKKLREIRYNDSEQAPLTCRLWRIWNWRVNIGQGQGQSADSVKSYLEGFWRWHRQ